MRIGGHLLKQFLVCLPRRSYSDLPHCSDLPTTEAEYPLEGGLDHRGRGGIDHQAAHRVGEDSGANPKGSGPDLGVELNRDRVAFPWGRVLHGRSLQVLEGYRRQPSPEYARNRASSLPDKRADYPLAGGLAYAVGASTVRASWAGWPAPGGGLHPPPRPPPLVG